MDKEKPKSDDPINEQIPCECGAKDCKSGLIITEYPEKKIKIRIFEGDEIKSVVVSKNKLMRRLNELK